MDGWTPHQRDRLGERRRGCRTKKGERIFSIAVYYPQDERITEKAGMSNISTYFLILEGTCFASQKGSIYGDNSQF
jgi:hypothetical protein